MRIPALASPVARASLAAERPPEPAAEQTARDTDEVAGGPEYADVAMATEADVEMSS